VPSRIDDSHSRKQSTRNDARRPKEIPYADAVYIAAARFAIFPHVDIRFRLVKQERNVSSGQPKGTTINSHYDSRGHRTFENTAR
jgi:hypothetical protein